MLVLDELYLFFYIVFSLVFILDEFHKIPVIVYQG